MADPERSAPVPWPVAAAVGVVAAIAAGWWWTREAPPAAGSADPPPAAASAPAPRDPPAVPATPGTGVLTVASGGRLAIDREALPADRPLVVDLRLGEPSADAEPRPVRVVSVDGRTLELSGRLGEARDTARIEIDPAWLAPGRYLVEVRTTEKTHLPLRRYVLEVR